MQRRCLLSLGRAFPLGLRTDSSNMDPRVPWRLGLQLAALNLQTNDLATQLHYALFELAGGQGYVKKPKEMLAADPAWPPDRTMLTRVTMTLVSLHHLPTRPEHRPQREGTHALGHRFVRALSGEPTPTR